MANIKTYMGNDLRLDQWLEYMKTMPKNVRFENYCFPSDKVRDEFIEKVHEYDESLILLILREFLRFGPPLGDDHNNLQFLLSRFKGKPDDLAEYLKTHPYSRRLWASFISRGKIPVYDSILWLLDLLPSNPSDALNVIRAFSAIHLAHLPDGRIFGLFDAESIIRARYFGAQTNTSVLYSLKPAEFEHVVEHLYATMGYKTKMTKLTHDRGRDVIATRNAAGKKEKIVVSCKRYKRNVSAVEVREVLAPVTDEKATKGVIITTSDFSADERKYAAHNPQLELINQKQLQRLMNEYIGTNWSAHLTYYIEESQRRHPKETRI